MLALQVGDPGLISSSKIWCPDPRKRFIYFRAKSLLSRATFPDLAAPFSQGSSPFFQICLISRTSCASFFSNADAVPQVLITLLLMLWLFWGPRHAHHSALVLHCRRPNLLDVVSCDLPLVLSTPLTQTFASLAHAQTPKT